MQIAQITDAIPHMIWTGAYIQNMILDAGYRLEEVIQAYKKGQAATHDMSMLWNLTAFKDINAEDTSVQEVTRKSQATVFMKIAVKNKSKDTQVYEVFAFNYWDDLTSTPVMMKYEGQNYLIYNSTSRCVKAIEEPRFKGVQEECREENFKDPKLSHWTKIPIANPREPSRPIVKKALFYNYIYCYGYNITFEDSTQICPTYPFRLPISSEFSTYGHHHMAITMKMNAVGPRWKIIDTSIPNRLLPEQRTSDIQLLETMSKLKAEKLMTEKEKGETISVSQKQAYMILVGASLAAVFLIYLGVTETINYVKERNDDRRDRLEYQRLRRRAPLVIGAQCVVKHPYERKDKDEPIEPIYEESST